MNKIKFSIYYLLFVICAPNAFAQTYVPFNYSPKFVGSEIVTGSLAVGQTISADASAVAELESTTKGFLLPRMTQAQREAIASPATGLMVYQTDGTEGFYYYTGAAWASIGLSTPVSVANGGTGISSYAIGDIIYASGATTLSKLPIGTANQQLRVNAGATALEYFTPASSGITVGSTTITSGTSGRLAYNLAGVYQESISYSITPTDASPYNVHLGFGAGSSGSYTGTQNTFIGHTAGKVVTGGLGQVLVGYAAGVAFTSSTHNIAIGNLAAASAATGWDDNVIIGYIAAQLGGSATIVDNVIIGSNACRVAAQSKGVAVGAFSGYSAGVGLNTVAVGTQTQYNSANNNCIVLGAYAQSTANNQCIIGAGAAAGGAGVVDNVYFNGVTFTSPAAVNLRNAGESGTDQSTTTGITIIPSLGTGTGNSAPFKVQSGVPTTTGTTQATPGDRLAVLGNYVALTEATATAFARVNIPSNSVAGGSVNVTVQANDGTEFQARTLEFAWSATNKAGTTDADISTPIEVVSISSGTLTVTITAVDAGSGNIDFKADATSSLTQTTLNAVCQVQKNFGTGSITQ